jgi:hypothetical protein
MNIPKKTLLLGIGNLASQSVGWLVTNNFSDSFLNGKIKHVESHASFSSKLINQGSDFSLSLL